MAATNGSPGGPRDWRRRESLPSALVQVGVVAVLRQARPVPLAPRLTAEDLAAHEAMVGRLGADAIWLSYADAAARPVQAASPAA